MASTLVLIGSLKLLKPKWSGKWAHYCLKRQKPSLGLEFLVGPMSHQIKSEEFRTYTAVMKLVLIHFCGDVLMTVGKPGSFSNNYSNVWNLNLVSHTSLVFHTFESATESCCCWKTFHCPLSCILKMLLNTVMAPDLILFTSPFADRPKGKDQGTFVFHLCSRQLFRQPNLLIFAACMLKASGAVTLQQAGARTP